MNKETVDILMASYNGARYIKSQILSIIAQTYQNWRLIIHDDGSSDDTVEIIKYFCSIDDRIIYMEDGVMLKNAGRHFMYMLKFVEAEYICFCDQDDIWLEDKLSQMRSVLIEKDNSKPQVIFSDAFLYFCDKNEIEGNLLSARPRVLKDLLFINGGIHGSASMFNKRMVDCINREFSTIEMHDHVLTFVGCTFGEIDYIEKKLFLYRQHNHNVTGNLSKNKYYRLINAFRGISSKYVLSCRTIDSLRSLYMAYKTELSLKDSVILDNYFRMLNAHRVKRFILIVKDGYTIANSRCHLWLKILTRRFFS